MFDSVNIGQFVSSVMEGCPEGSLQVAEISRPITGNCFLLINCIYKKSYEKIISSLLYFY